VGNVAIISLSPKKDKKYEASDTDKKASEGGLKLNKGQMGMDKIRIREIGNQWIGKRKYLPPWFCRLISSSESNVSSSNPSFGLAVEGYVSCFSEGQEGDEDCVSGKGLSEEGEEGDPGILPAMISDFVSWRTLRRWAWFGWVMMTLCAREAPKSMPT